MSLGFGKVSAKDWAKAKKGAGGDKVPVGDYFVELVQVSFFDPSKSDKGLGRVLLTFETTDDNEEAGRDKTLVGGYSYHPNPAGSQNESGYTKMNEITEQALVQLIDRTGMEPVETPEGDFDLFASLKQLAKMKPNLIVGVTHDGEYQNLGSFRPIE